MKSTVPCSGRTAIGVLCFNHRINVLLRIAAACVIALPFLLCEAWLREDEWAPPKSSHSLPRIDLTRFDCVDAQTVRDRRCFFHHVYIVDNVVWVVYDKPADVPRLLCTAVDEPPAYVRYCSVEWHRPEDLINRLAEEGVQLLHYDTGVAFSRLNPGNLYHTMLEDHMPVFELLHGTPELQHWLEPPGANTPQRLLLYQDQYRDCHPGLETSRLLFPGVDIIEGPPDPTAVFHVRLLVAGTKASCVHASHCRRGRFLTPELGTAFRRFALGRAGAAVEAPPPPGRPPRVTVVQRNGTRRIANLGEVLAAVNGALAAQYGTSTPNATLVDFGQLTVRQQLQTARCTDILVMVHGAVYGSAVFLPRHAIVIDLYPYGFHPEQHGFHLN
eukprot:EG_transcript_14634